MKQKYTYKVKKKVMSELGGTTRPEPLVGQNRDRNRDRDKSKAKTRRADKTKAFRPDKAELDRQRD